MEVWLALYECKSSPTGYRIGSVTFESYEQCKQIANREDFVRPIGINLSTSTWKVERIGK